MFRSYSRGFVRRASARTAIGVLLVLGATTFVIPCRGSTVSVTCGSTITAPQGSLSCSNPDSSYADASLFGTTASLLVSGSSQVLPHDVALASASFDVVETWTVLGGTGNGSIWVFGLPPFIDASARQDPFSDNSFYLSGFGFTEGSVGGLLGSQTFSFTFGVPFSFDSPVSLSSADYDVDGGSVSVSYSTTSMTYGIPSEAIATGGPWVFIPNGSGPMSVTLERSAQLAPEPGPLWPSMALLFGLFLYRNRYGAEHL